MLALYGVDDVIRNLYCLARLQSAEAKITNTEELRHHYLSFLASRQPHAPVNWNDDVFVDDERTEQRLSAAFSEGLLNDLGQADVFGPSYSEDIRQRKLSFARKCVAELLHLDSDVDLVFGLVIHTIFLKASKPSSSSRGSHGGSSSAAIGTIWLTVEDALQRVDIMEMLVHELTHHLLFIDELNHAQFAYSEIAKPENFARSAILKRNRPLDKVVHSIVVATEILEARRKYLYGFGPSKIHPPSDALKQDTEMAIESVLTLPNLNDLITSHLREVLAKCTEVCCTVSA